MPTYLVYVVFALVGLILQSSLLQALVPFGAVPNFVVILVVHYAFFGKRNSGPLGAFVLGLLFDLFGSHLLIGPYASAAVLVYLGVMSVSKRLYMESTMTLVLVVFCAAYCNSVVASLIMSQFVPVESVWSVIIRYAPFEALGSAILSPLIFSILRRIGVEGKPRSKSGEVTWAA